MAKTNKECYTCGQKYYYCPTCPSEKKEIYNNMFCCERCSKIFKTLTDETFKRIDISECKNQLMTLNVSINETFKDGIKKHITRILDYKEPIEENTQEEIVSLETDVTTEIHTIENIVEENVVKKTYYTPKKSRKPRNSEVD